MAFSVDVLRERASTRWILFSACLLSGCGETHEPTFPVSGQVVFKDGSTLPLGGKVVFQSVHSEPQVTANGYFGADGKFELTTFTEGDGAPAGEYKVIIEAFTPDDRGSMSEKEYKKARQPISPKYRSTKSSGIKFAVSPETAPHNFRIEVTPPRIGLR